MGEGTAGERADLLQALTKARHFLRHTTRGMDDKQAAQQTTVSELCLGGLIKHVTLTERQWAEFIVTGPAAMSPEGAGAHWADGFRMTENDTLAALLDNYQQVARKTDELIASEDLDASHPLPQAPWFPPGAHW